jgi:hypothetical protein
MVEKSRSRLSSKMDRASQIFQDSLFDKEKWTSRVLERLESVEKTHDEVQ